MLPKSPQRRKLCWYCAFPSCTSRRTTRSRLAACPQPDPFLVLEQAQVLAESAEQRLLEYAGLVSTAATLYARDQRPSRNDPGKTRSRIMNEAYMWFLGPVCLARFKEYSPLEQRRLVDKARERVYLAAQSVLVQQLWEDADQLVCSRISPYRA